MTSVNILQNVILLLIDGVFPKYNIAVIFFCAGFQVKDSQIAADSFVPAGMSDGNGGVFKTDDTSYYDADKTGTDQVEEAKNPL